MLVRLCLAAKNAPAIPFTLSREFGKLTPQAQIELEPLLREWVLSADSTERFDALAIVDDHLATSLIPTLSVLRDRLEESTEFGAVYEREK